MNKYQDLVDKYFKEHYPCPLDLETFLRANKVGIDIRKSAIGNFARYLDELKFKDEQTN